MFQSSSEKKRVLQITSNLRNIECPFCGGPMLRSRRSPLQRLVHLYWQKPWGSTLRMDEPVVPLACVQCGGVIFALRDAARVAREWVTLGEEERSKLLSSEE
ncbi:MAG: hypothetical protein AB1665_06970 [Candidatus Thermoplasmatota archaeon]